MKKTILLLLGLFTLTLAQAQMEETKAKAWQGDAEAMLELSEAYLFGTKLEKNEDSAAYYVRKAADKGHPDGQFLLGLKYMTKVHSSRDYDRGIALLKDAAQQGHASAQARLCEVYSTRGRGTQTDRYYSLAKAYSYADAAAQQNHKEMLLYCAEARLKGRGVSRNDSIAVAYVRQAAQKKNFMPAQLRLANLYWDGTVTGYPEPIPALRIYKNVKENRYANIDQRSAADLKIHEIDQYVKQVQNIMFDAGGWLPPGAFEYQMRN